MKKYKQGIMLLMFAVILLFMCKNSIPYAEQIICGIAVTFSIWFCSNLKKILKEQIINSQLAIL